ncbi:YeeE/YedE family protein [Thioalkalivibrio sp. ALJT]|uniref:YeeE/YedE family protein n=1 Tax=Thioalkalivibrio sp. ALJT TaxID=1158146 RepID=UPI0003625493|nr:YeeE/YedE family protein [Thioalkalivibrio sp. ALJT]
MEFSSFSTAAMAFLGGTFILAFIMGAVANKTNFCTMGAVSDWVNMGDTGRMRSWLLAIAVAMLGVSTLEFFGVLSAEGSFPPYRMENLNWLGHVLGGFLFGIGMTYGSGCGNKTLVRVGGGNIKSVMVMILIGVVAYLLLSTQPVFGTGQTLNQLLFGWMGNTSITLSGGQDLGSIVAGDNATGARLVLGLLIGVLLLALIFKAADFRKSFDNILGGLVIGLVVVGAWWLTSNVQIADDMGDTYTPTAYLSDWEFLGEPGEDRPADQVRFWENQSFTFIAPMGQSVGYVKEGFDSRFLYFGVVALAGVILGSFFWALISRSFRIEWFSSFRDFGNHFVGGILMGVGGILAMGCTVGQAITGVSTLALGGFLTFAFIVFGSALTMKIQYYKMVYEDEATFGKALVTSLVDMKLLPGGMRKLEAI